MILVYLIFLNFGTTPSNSVIAERDPNYAYCFQFSWLGPPRHTAPNCSALDTTPCSPPFFATFDGTPPNMTFLWNNHNQTEITCSLDPGFACIKYSYTYNNAILNTTYFCGKMIEDTTTAVTSGCYSQQVGGHTIEACACLSSSGGRIPCNSSTKLRRSLRILIILTLVSMFLCNI